MTRRAVACAILWVTCAVVSFAQTTTGQTTTGQIGQPQGTQPQTQQPPAAAPVVTPDPYGKDEFPGWMQDVWRTAVVFVGTLPFSFFFVTEGYDVYRYAFGIGSAIGPFDPANAPWPFRTAASITYSSTEEFGIIATTLGLSAFAAAVDFTIEHWPKSDENR